MLKGQHPRARKGAFVVYSWTKAQQFFPSPVAMLYDALKLVTWKNTKPEELKAFRERLRETLTDVIKRKAKRKYRKKIGPTLAGQQYLAFLKWARARGLDYDRELFKVFKESWPNEPVWIDEVPTNSGEPARPSSGIPGQA